MLQQHSEIFLLILKSAKKRRLRENLWTVTRLKSTSVFFSSFLLCCAVSLHLSTFFLSPFIPAFFTPPSLVSLSRTFMKGELLCRRECGSALRSLSPSMRQSFFYCFSLLIQFGCRQVLSSV